MSAETLPAFDELPMKGELRHSWGLWGADDALGCLNLLTPERRVAALAHVVDGISIPLDWDSEMPNPPMFGRRPFTRRVERRSPTSQDESLDGWNSQSSSQWDGFRHVRSTAHGFYNGLDDEQHGVAHWAEAGIVGRAALVDIPRYRASLGRPLDYEASDPITVEDLGGALELQGTQLRGGDILLIRTGWIDWYLQQDEATRAHIAVRGNLVGPGLQPVEDMARFLWNSHVAAVALDNPAMELWPLGAGRTPEEVAEYTNDPTKEHLIQLHVRLMPMLGIPVGELFFLERLAEHCAAVGRYEMLFTSAPMHLVGGVATPPNAIALL